MRRLEVSVAGRWFLALTVLLGVVALVSGNNVLYLTESLLLSGLILSGILSERAISAIEIELHRQPATAGEPSRDRVVIRNTRRFPLFCLEILEWSSTPKRRYSLVAFLPRLGGREEISITSSRSFDSRGWQSWEGLGVATSYPFGFARKLRIWRDPGSRRVWPSKTGAAGTTGADERRRALHAGGEISEGDVRPFVQGDDPRLIVWRLSSRGGEPVVRSRRSPDWREDPRLDLRTPAGPGFETEVIRAAGAFYQDETGDTGTLTLVGHAGTRRILGRARALDELAVIQAEGPHP